ncbi:MAG: porin [Arsenophonus sp.]|nr:MAG: porin [Arsenophonus sp.]
MMKRNILAIVIPVLLAGTVHAAEIYNKDGDTVDIYGKVDVHHLFSKNSINEESDNSRVHIGIKGETQISDKLSGFGRFEWNEKTNKREDDNKNRNHIAYAGLKFADFGSLDYGRNYTVLHDVKAWTEVLPLHSGKAVYQIDDYMTSHNRNLLTYRSNDFFGFFDGLNLALQYQRKNTENNKSDIENAFQNNGDGFGISANYDLGWGVMLGAGYNKSNIGINYNTSNVKTENVNLSLLNNNESNKSNEQNKSATSNKSNEASKFALSSPNKSNEQNKSAASNKSNEQNKSATSNKSNEIKNTNNVNVLNTNNKIQSEKNVKTTENSVDKDSQAWNIGLKYNANNIYLAALYGKAYHNVDNFAGKLDNFDIKQKVNTTENIEVVAQYLFDDISLKPSIAYVQSKGKDFINIDNAKKEDLTKYISLGAFYYFNKHLTAVVDYKINLIHSNDFIKKYSINKDNIFGLGLVYKF